MPKVRTYQNASGAVGYRLLEGVDQSDARPAEGVSLTVEAALSLPVPALSRLLPPSPAPPGSGCPRLHRPVATGTAAKVFTSIRTPAPHGAPHGLRHTCASLLLAQGVSPRVVMDALGHSSIAVTMNAYGHVMPLMQRDAADRMNEQLR
jgi:integrase